MSGGVGVDIEGAGLSEDLADCEGLTGGARPSPVYDIRW